MLSMIKGMINQKKDFLEAAEIIFEDGMGNALDDAIILGEESDNIPQDNEPMVEDENNDESKNDTPEDHEIPEEEENKHDQDDAGDFMDQPIDGEDPAEVPAGDDGSMSDEPIDAPVGDEDPVTEPHENSLPLPGDDSLPEPVSNVTGEPVADDNILTMELDLSTNTPKDVLPVPPAHAGDAVVSDDIINQRIDSGFGGEGGESPMDAPIEDPMSAPVESNESGLGDMMSEAITIADPASDPAPVEGAPAEEPAPVEGEGDITSDPVSTNESDNEVTAAVKDKVAEADDPAYDGDPDSTKEELMKKLSNITKSLEDAKRAVMSAI